MKDGLSLYGGLFHNTNLTIVFHAFVLLVSIIIIELTAFLPRNYPENSSYNEGKLLIHNIKLSDKTKEQYAIIEYPLVVLFVIVGGILLISSSDVISIFLSIELQSYGLYLLCALYRNSESSTGAGLTYFLLGGLSSCFILLASAILYTNSGTTSLNGYYMLANILEVDLLADNLIY
jgi:NADH-ubiquinone oxidoreductase chain 2